MKDQLVVHWRTTLAGVAASVAQAYCNGAFTDPTPERVVSALAVAVLGYFAKG